MADNVPLPAAAGNAAADEANYSGDTAKIQLVRVVDVTGAEGGKTVISNDAIVSTANSSTALLILSGTFTGTAEDVTNFATITVSVFASHASATDGLQLQQSSDGVFWDLVDSFTIPATTGKTFGAAVQAKFFRVVYTNGGVMQTAFRLQTIFSKSVKKGSSIRPQDARTNDNDFEEVASYLNGYNGSTWDRLKATLGALHVAQPDVTASGSLTAAAQLVNLPLTGQSSAVVQITGTWVGTITFEGTADGTNFNAINGVFSSSSTPKPTATVNGTYRISPAALASFQARMSSYTSGTAVVTLRASYGTGGTFANQVLPVEIDPRRVITFKGRAGSFRIPGRAGTAGQNLFSLHNATASTIIVDLERMTLDMTATVVKAVTVLPPAIRLYRVTVLPTNGTAVTKVAQDTSLSSSASLTLLQDASADGTSSGTTLTATIPAGNVAASVFAPRLITAAGYEVLDTFTFLEGDENRITLRPLEGVVLRLDYTLATQNPVTDMWIVDVRWVEYTAA